MKKILALALVLVLALGMMVPVTAASKNKIEGWLSVPANDYVNWDALPGDDLELPFSLSSFDLSDEAITALGAARSPSALASLMLKIAETAEPRFRVRSGGQIFDGISVDSVTAPDVTISTTALATALGAPWNAAVNFPNNPFSTTAMSSISAFNKAVDGASTMSSDDKPAVKAAFLDLFLEALIAGDWTFTVLLETVDPFVNVNTVDYEVDIYFLINGARTDTTYICTVAGEFGNETTPVDNDTYDVDSYKGQVIEAEEYVSKIAICGNYEYDINANVKMAKDKKIYFYVVTESDTADEPVFDKYPAIEMAFKVYQVGLNSYTGNFISLDGVDSTYYVYGKDANGALKYLGRGGEMLPLSSKYYISTAKLDITDNSSIDEDLPTDPVPEDNFNPSTGI